MIVSRGLFADNPSYLPISCKCTDGFAHECDETVHFACAEMGINASDGHIWENLIFGF